MEPDVDWPAGRDEAEVLAAVERRARQLRRRRRLAVVPVSIGAVVAVVVMAVGGSGKPTTVQVGPASDGGTASGPTPMKVTAGTATTVKQVAATTVVTAKTLEPTTAPVQKTPGSTSTTVLKKLAPTTTSIAGDVKPATTVPVDKAVPPTKSTVTTTASPPQTMGISATTVTPGTPLWVKGVGCTPGTEAKGAWDGTILGTTTVEAAGWFALTFTVPADAAIGDHSAYVKCLTPDGAGSATTWTVKVVQAIPTPTIAVIGVGGDATAGQPLSVKGGNFVGGSLLTIALDGVTLTTAPANADGTFAVTVTIPLTTTPGQHAISVTGGDRGAKVPVTVLAAK